MKKQTCWRFHPVTGQDAEDFSKELVVMPDKDREELAAMSANGATFWWIKDTDGEIARIEKINYSFVANVMGIQLEFDSVPPLLRK